MGNRPHPHRREETRLIHMTDAEFEQECDAAYLEGKAIEEAEKAARIWEYDNSPEQRDWEADEPACEDGGSCQHDECHEYWDAKGQGMYGNSYDPDIDRA
jgi:hypothetical protein